MRIVCFVGYSGSGKTTLIEELIRFFVSRGLTVAALKHTHHALTGESRGDTDRFLRAGAREAILAGDDEAVRWRSNELGPSHFRYNSRDELIALISDADWLLIEGYKSDPMARVVVVGELDDWPRNVVAHVADRASPRARQFRRNQWAELGEFLDRIDSQ